MSLQSAFAFFPAGPSDLFSPPPASPDTVFISSDYTLDGEDSLVIDGSPGLKVQVRQGANVHVQLDGTVDVSSALGDVTGLVTTRSLQGQATITVNNAFQAHAFGQGDDATGLELLGEFDRLTSNSSINVISDGGSATGVAIAGDSAVFNNFGALSARALDEATGVAAAPGAQTVNYGSITVAAQHQALGFFGVTPAPTNYFVNLGAVQVTAVGGAAHGGDPAIAAGAAIFGGGFGNAGEIHVSAHGVAIGVELLQMSNASNGFGGVIEAHASGADAEAIGVLMGSPYGPSAAFVNQGLVRADMAISTSYPGFGGSEIAGFDAVENYGKIVGDISLGAGDDSVLNGGLGGQGWIKGDVLLGDGDDVFDSRGGKIDGAVWGGLDDDHLRGSGGADVLHGDDAAGLDGGADQLIGLKGADTLDGGLGQDTINGGLGADQLTGGGDADVFVYNRAADSTASATDIITDLDGFDSIDLHRIDADTGAGGDQAFHLVSSFTGQAGELTVEYNAGLGQTVISGDVDGDAAADLVIFVVGDHHDFTNFLL